MPSRLVVVLNADPLVQNNNKTTMREVNTDNAIDTHNLDLGIQKPIDTLFHILRSASFHAVAIWSHIYISERKNATPDRALYTPKTQMMQFVQETNAISLIIAVILTLSDVFLFSGRLSLRCL